LGKVAIDVIGDPGSGDVFEFFQGGRFRNQVIAL
jgi:hypothetical protein